MSLKLALIFALVAFLSPAHAQEPFIACDYFNYFVNSTETYACHLRIQNPDGLEFASIDGDHLPEMTNDDVIAVITLIGDTSTVPRVICSEFPNVGILDLSFLHITTITGESFSGCENVHWLRLYYNRVLSLPADTFVHTPRLTFLDLNHFGVTSVPEDLFAPLVDLEFLEMASNPLSSLPRGLFAGLSRLHTLFLSNLLLTEVDEGLFESLESLSYLTLYSNQLTSLPERVFESLSELTVLDIGGNAFGDDLPGGIFSNLTHLVTLSMSEIGVRNLTPELFASLANLHQLSLSNNAIQELPRGIFASLANIERISLWNNRVKTVEREAFGSVDTLRYLDIDMNVVNSMDERVFSDAVNLQSLYFSNNLCASGYFFNFQQNRASFLDRLGRCFRNFGFTVDTDTEADTPYRFFTAPTPGVQLRVQSTEEIRIAITPFDFPWQPMVEIIIGAGNNTRSIIRRNEEIDVAVVPTPGILRDDQLNGFRVTWANHIVLVHREGEPFPFLAHTMQDFFNVNFYGLRSPSNRATWSIQPIDREDL